MHSWCAATSLEGLETMQPSGEDPMASPTLILLHRRATSRRGVPGRKKAASLLHRRHLSRYLSPLATPPLSPSLGADEKSLTNRPPNGFLSGSSSLWLVSEKATKSSPRQGKGRNAGGGG